jgi:hypothetical protein
LERSPDELLKERTPFERRALLVGLALLAASIWIRDNSSLADQLAQGPVWAAAVPADPKLETALWRYDASYRDLRGVLLPPGASIEEAERLLGAASIHRIQVARPPDSRVGSRWCLKPSELGKKLHSDLSVPDRVIAALEALSLPPEEHPVAVFQLRSKGKSFIADEALAAKLKERFLGRPAPSPAKAVVEVLNASGKDGLALTATRTLRSRGVDVLNYASEPASPVSRIIDRDGDRASAERLRSALGVDLPIVTELTAYPKAEATLILGTDFPESALR